jgi:serralysin
MASAVSVERTNNQDIDGILSGRRWDSLNLTYSFPKDASLYGDAYGWGEARDNFGALGEGQSAVTRHILGTISAVTNLDFAEIEETPASEATLRLARSDAPSPAWSYLPGDTREGGDTWFGNSSGLFDAPVLGNYAYYAFIHEILHAVGLKHGNEGGMFGAMTAGHDSMEYSVMTYRSYVGSEGLHVENETWGYAQTLMIHDIAALQHMYGADFTTNGGNSVYRWSPTTGQSFVNGVGQEAPGANRIFMTIWDGGGLDAYDFSNYRTSLTVDLRPGAWSTVSANQLAQLGPGHYARGNIANALTHHGDLRSLIENAIGGSGNDTIIGNAVANSLKGGSGADRLDGLEGADRLAGGRGNDILKGGAGRDVLVFDTRPSKTANLDRIANFSVVDDTIHMDNAVFTKAGSAGRLASGAFWKGAKAHDSSDRVVYDGGTGRLYYDADGAGKAAQTQFAQLSKGLKVTAADFFVI